jgi:hypothetical protein
MVWMRSSDLQPALATAAPHSAAVQVLLARSPTHHVATLMQLSVSPSGLQQWGQARVGELVVVEGENGWSQTRSLLDEAAAAAAVQLICIADGGAPHHSCWKPLA